MSEDLKGEILENRMTCCNIKEYKVLEESQDYYIVEKTEDHSLRAIEKNRCSVVVIRGPVV